MQDAVTLVREVEVPADAVKPCADVEWFVNCLEYTHVEGAVWVRPDSNTSGIMALLAQEEEAA